MATESLSGDVKFELGRITGAIEGMGKAMTAMGSRLDELEEQVKRIDLGLSEQRGGVKSTREAARILLAAAGVIAAVVASTIALWHAMTGIKV